MEMEMEMQMEMAMAMETKMETEMEMEMQRVSGYCLVLLLVVFLATARLIRLCDFPT
jgi:hypothetical protein